MFERIILISGKIFNKFLDSNAIADLTPSVFSGSVPGDNLIVVLIGVVEISIKNSWWNLSITTNGRRAENPIFQQKLTRTLWEYGSFEKLE